MISKDPIFSRNLSKEHSRSDFVLRLGNVEYDECGSTPLPANNAKIVEVTQASPSQTVWQMQIAGQFAYRGFRMPSLYPGVQW